MQTVGCMVDVGSTVKQKLITENQWICNRVFARDAHRWLYY